MNPLYQSVLDERPIDQLDVRQVLRVPPHSPLSRALETKDQATVVLALLRAARLPAAEHLVGKPITRVPTLRSLSPPLRSPDDSTLDRRTITRVEPNPRLPTTPAWSRYRLFRVGRTLGEFLLRGGRRGDVRLALRRGWISVEGER